MSESTTVLEPICFCYLHEEEIGRAPLSEILPALNAVAAINNLNLNRAKEMKKAYRILLHLIRNN